MCCKWIGILVNLVYFYHLIYFLKIFFQLEFWRSIKNYWSIIALQCCFYQNQSAIYIHISPPSWNSLPPILYSTSLGYHRASDLSSLRHTGNSHWLSNFTCGSVYASLLLSQFFPPTPSPLCSQVCCLCLRLHCCPAKRFIRSIFLDSIYTLRKP